MKPFLPLLLSMCLAFPLNAQTGEPPAIPAPSVPAITITPRTPEALDTLLGPIALYPDVLVALILPAATTPSDVVLASRYVQAKGDPAAVTAQPWDDSIKALVRYPDVLKWMDDNLAWTQALGQAFLDQPADVMNTVQRLRTRAQASGALLNTPQQHVLTTGSTIVIVPAQPDIIYVPVYDPQVVYVQRTVWVSHPLLVFSIGYEFGLWSGYDCDWGRRNVRIVSRPAGWQNRPQSWNSPGIPAINQPSQPWRPHVQKPRSDNVNSTASKITNGSPGMKPSTPNRPTQIRPATPPASLQPAAAPASGMVIAPAVTAAKPSRPALTPTQPAPAAVTGGVTARPSATITAQPPHPVITPPVPATSAAQPLQPLQVTRPSSSFPITPQGRADRAIRAQTPPASAVTPASGDDTTLSDHRKRKQTPVSGD